MEPFNYGDNFDKIRYLESNTEDLFFVNPNYGFTIYVEEIG